MEMVSDVGIQEIVAHIASHCEQVSRRAFSTASTITMTGRWAAGGARRPTVRVDRTVGPQIAQATHPAITFGCASNRACGSGARGQ